MSSQVFPALAGVAWSVKRTPLWKTRVQEAISGKRTRVADWSFPRWQWELAYDFLRQAGATMQAASFAGQAYGEFAQLPGFFYGRQGRFASLLYPHPHRNPLPGPRLAPRTRPPTP